jgi:hypothetical protein
MAQIDDAASPSRMLEIVRLVEESDEPVHRAWLRGMADQPAVKGAILVALASQADEVDRPCLWKVWGCGSPRWCAPV